MINTNTASGAADFTDVQYLEQMANHYASSPVPEIRAHQKRLRAIAAALASAAAPAQQPNTACAALPAECDSPELCAVSRSCAGQFGTKRICASRGQAPAGLAVPSMSADEVNALPTAARAYIHQLATNTDPAGMVRENMQLRDTNAGLQSMYRKAADAAQEVVGCFHAAECEGLQAALAGTADEHLKDLVERRLMHALYAAQEVAGQAPAQAAPAAVAGPKPGERCQHCIDLRDGFYGSYAPPCPYHDDDGKPRVAAPTTQTAPQQEAQESCPTCIALARTVMLDQVSFDRKPDCYGIRQITDDEGVEEWEDIRTSPDVAREEANDMMATGRGEIYEVVPLYTTPQPVQVQAHAGMVPLTKEQRNRIVLTADTVSEAIDMVERHHGIKGGQRD